jgi:hypothetical protein
MKLLNQRGQGTAELAIITPLFILIAGAAIAIGYMCWQGIRVQQAANYAARIQGQERIGGGTSERDIKADNGTAFDGDQDPSSAGKNTWQNVTALNDLHHAPPGGLYGRIYSSVQGFFSKGEQARLFIPQPDRGLTTDKVKVIRVLNPPNLFGFKLDPIILKGEAYGGEDPHMYGLPRWGSTPTKKNYYQGPIEGTD